jgi:hypothetical protein
MAVSASDSLSQIPGFRDPLGERIIVPQQSGTLLEFLHFCDQLATAPFFGQALKDRVARLGNFRHSSYCRVRRVQQVVELDGRLALVSAHTAGQRLTEVLEVAARTDLKPSTAGALAVTRQLMASVALLHDFAPYGFHGALGPDRVILAGEGRIVLAEHVLGTVVEEAVEAWGAARLWQEFRIAALPDPKSSHYGRRVDVVQVGLVALALLLGRPLGALDYPQGLSQLLDQVEETTAEGTQVPLRPPLRGWLERTLGLHPDSAFRTLLEAQKAFGQLLQEENYSPSFVGWEAFVGVCETAALRVPVVVVTPDVPRVDTDAQLAREPIVASVLTQTTAIEGERPEAAASVPVVPLSPSTAPPPADQGAVPAEAVTVPHDSGKPEVRGDADPMARLREDPFGPWPVASPTGSAATLLETFDTPSAPQSAAAALAAVPATSPEPPRAAADLWATAPGGDAYARPEPKPETLFEAPQPRPVEPPARMPAVQVPEWDEPKAPATTSVADWRTRDRGPDLSYLVLSEEEARVAAERELDVATEEEERAFRRSRRIRVAVLIGLALLAAAAALLAPYAWKVVFEGRLVQGTLQVDSDPQGAVISIDGQVRGHTPAELSVRAGEHLLEVQIGGSATAKKVAIKANGKTAEKMTFPEAGERGGLMITTYPSKGKVTVDGIARGDAPVKVTDLQPGSHTLVVETAHGAQEQDVVVQSGRVSQLAVPTVSWLRVTAPFELTVYENGRLIGTTGSAPVMIAPGRRYLDFVNKPVGLRLRQYVDAVAGQVVTVPLEMPTGMMNLYADLQAEVLVDGTVVGQTPLPSLQVPLGSHDVIFRHPKYGDVRYTVAVTLTAPVKLNVTFQRK